MFGEHILRTTRNLRDAPSGARQWFRFENRDSAAPSVYIYDEIGFFGITAADFLSEFRDITAPAVTLHLNSPGGDVFDGIAIYNELRSHRAKVNVVVDSIAASIASVIAMAGDTVTMTRGSMMMIHEPYSLVLGDAADMRKQAEALDIMGNSIASIYAARAGGTVIEWRARMAEETWYGDQGAVDAGLADAVAADKAAKNTFDLSVFRNPPAIQQEPVEPDWRKNARLRLASAHQEVVHALAH